MPQPMTKASLAVVDRPIDSSDGRDDNADDDAAAIDTMNASMHVGDEADPEAAGGPISAMTTGCRSARQAAAAALRHGDFSPQRNRAVHRCTARTISTRRCGAGYWKSRTSASVPLIAAAAAIAGLTRWVRPPRP